MTGGGAVFHDMGNLNFSIIQPLEQYDIEKSMILIVDALKEIGIKASVNGRNDICIGEKKISGNAYYKGEKAGLHHGTLLFSYNPRIMKAAITPSKSKLLKHGVKSVESRVGDISSVYQSVSIKLIAKAIRHSFERDADLVPFEADTFDLEDLRRIQGKYDSEEWNYNKVREYELVFEDSFSWGEVSLSINYEDDRLKQIDISSDSMHVDLIEQIKEKINDSINKKMEKNLIFQNIENEYKGEAIISDLADMWRKVIKNGI
jgi:lipoate-protein ligase A